eukprot:TRINITY_DN180_c0_g6_i1.p1 TRINITY_DN180_c0_g6~~TRINITY_DN180_c0_g6_i1.p1  ORF type:complete len:277 (-),score=69.35 TRINITY_DN180_c0_g6_i1:155-871(-)
MNIDETSEWKLYYWPGFPGRGDFIRLLFEETQTSYDDVYTRVGAEGSLERIMKWREEGVAYAYPVVVHKGVLYSQTGVTVRHVAKMLDGGRLFPKSYEDEVFGEIITAGVTDLVSISTDAWHPLHPNMTFEQNKGPEQDRCIKLYSELYFPRWMAFFESALKKNKGGRGFFLGEDITYVDLVVYHMLCGNKAQLPELWESTEIPLLKAFLERISKRPNIKAFLESPRRTKFTMTAPCM